MGYVANYLGSFNVPHIIMLVLILLIQLWYQWYTKAQSLTLFCFCYTLTHAIAPSVQNDVAKKSRIVPGIVLHEQIVNKKILFQNTAKEFSIPNTFLLH